jgi:acyl-CoA reductase-like NAD-dependent aldehyde dehydrogenase
MPHNVESLLESADVAQQVWAAELVQHRVAKIATLSGMLATRYQEFLDAIVRPGATDAEKLASEILPLADACRFTCAIARRTLAARTQAAWGGSWWLGRVAVQTMHDPWGTILILAPSNYPLFLPGVQLIQALVAGNAVVVKPAPGHSAVLQLLKSCLQEAGVPADLFQILDPEIEYGVAAIRSGVDKVILTGSLATGKSVLKELADSLTPATMELSGCDAVFVLPQADVGRAAKAVCYGLQLNSGRTCIAPRRIFVTPDNRGEFEQALNKELAESQAATRLHPQVFSFVQRVVQEALSSGATVLSGQLPATAEQPCPPLVLTNVKPSMKIARSDLFAPIASILPVDSVDAALAADKACPYSLGASVFGPDNYARYVCGQLSAGCVTVNDIIAPTADPRVSFGGRDQSGWGVTRGAEGLLSMTRPKVICVRRGKWLPHLDRKLSQDSQALAFMLQVFHAPKWVTRWQALKSMVAHVRHQKGRR